ncbi:MAG: hypothetical protein KGY46_05070 [Anaerolineales bacterium]|nr:hypothetical protein [Anaerolineales bacterium]
MKDHRLSTLQRCCCALILIWVLAGCATLPASTEPQVDPKSTQTPPPTLQATATPAFSATPTSTAAPSPTVTPSPTATPFVCREFQESVALLVEEIYLQPLKAELDQFTRDLCQDGYQAILHPVGSETPQEIRGYLQELYFEQTDETLAGAILIGDIPNPYLQIRVDYLGDRSPRYDELISLWYYSDLDGEFALSDDYQPLDGQEPLGEPIFDIHPEQMEWEIWVSVLPPYLGDVNETVSALERYFKKNHAYRVGEIDLPRRYIYVTHYEATTQEDHDEFVYHLLEGNLNWSALKGDGEPLLFFNSEPGGLSEMEGYQAISEGQADVAVVIGHGNVGSVLKINNPWLEANQMQTNFLWTHSCSVGNLDNQYNILSQITYHPHSLVLFTSGNTCDAGGFGINQNDPGTTTLAVELSQGATLGEAILKLTNTPLVNNSARNPELVFGPKIYFGDLTLRLRGVKP